MCEPTNCVQVLGSRPQWWWVGLLAVVFALAAWVVWRMAARLPRRGGPGLRSYVRAEDVREVRRIFRTWGPSGRSAARVALLAEFARLVPRALVLAAASAVVADRAGVSDLRWLYRVGLITLVIAVLAGLVHLVGNVLLLAQLRSPNTLSGGMVQGARWAGQLQRTLSWLVAMYVLVGYGVVMLAG